MSNYIFNLFISQTCRSNPAVENKVVLLRELLQVLAFA